MKNAALFFALFFVATDPFCHADWFEGEVSRVDLRFGELTVTEIDPITGTEDAEVIAVLPATVFSGVRGLKDIKTGDEVTVEARYDESSDSWQAVSVEIPGAGE